VFVGLQKGLLKHVFGVFAILSNAHREAEYSRFIRPYQRPEGGGIARAGTAHQRQFRPRFLLNFENFFEGFFGNFFRNHCGCRN
jgi:hypothetical protein